MDDFVLISFGEELCEATQRYVSAVQSGNDEEQRINRKRLEEAYTCLRYYAGPMTQDFTQPPREIEK